MKPARRLELMIKELKEVRVEQLSHRDWLSVLNLLDVSIREVNRIGSRRGFEILLTLVKRAQRSSLPVPRRDTPEPDAPPPSVPA